ncbi:MAG: RDD family protein [Mycobacterium sp.]
MTAEGIDQAMMADDSAERELVTGEAVALDVRPANFMLRTAGTLLDVVAQLVLLAVLGWLLLNIGTTLRIDEALAQAWMVGLLVFCLVIVPMVVETVTQGRSLGKLAIGARIVRDDGGSIGLRHAFIRALTGVIEIYLTFGGLAALTALLNGKSKRLGDLLAGTYSQHERVPRVVEPVYGVPVSLQGWAPVADVARMPDPLARRVTQFVKQATGMTAHARLEVAEQLAAEVAEYVSPLPAVSAEDLLAGVSAIRRERDHRALVLEAERLDRLRPALTGTPHGFPRRR